MSFCAIVFLFFGVIFFAACLLAPLFGGRFILSGVLFYASWVGLALCFLFEARRIKAKKINDGRFILLNIFEFVSWIFYCLLRFRFPYNLVGAILGGAFFLFLKFYGYKSLKGQIAAQEIK